MSKARLEKGHAFVLILVCLFFTNSAATVCAQHTGHGTAQPSPTPSKPAKMPGMQMPSPTPVPQASPRQPEMSMPLPSPGSSPQPGATQTKGTPNMPGMNDTKTNGPQMVMSGGRMAIRVGSVPGEILSMGQMGSGTAWEPASTPSSMWSSSKNNWLLMFHFNLVTGFNSQGGPRGVKKFESENWFMGMALHRVGSGMLELRSMLSAEPFTLAKGGSPLLFQTGESYRNQPLIDKQHPHDLFMELAAEYTLPLGERGTWFTYFGYPGEPALGPTTFMHRASAVENPSAPLSHHLQDSTHVSFGVFTTGFTYRRLKLEGSVFNGREPDENRYNFEAHPWNSRSARLSYAPAPNWSMQVSYGFLRNPETLEPGDTRRTTASIGYNKVLQSGNWATSLIWGRNHESHGAEVFNLNGYTAESTINFAGRNYLYTRLELADKNGLLRAADRLKLGIKEEHPSFRIGAYTFGGARDFWNTEKFAIALGGDMTFYTKPARLDPIYGDHPVSWKLFLRIRPAKMSMSSHATHDLMNKKEAMPAKP
jgi:hypothetical protein